MNFQKEEILKAYTSNILLILSYLTHAASDFALNSALFRA